MKKTKLSLPPCLNLDGSIIIEGDALYAIRQLPSKSLQCVVTSPPYWGLRDYEMEGQIGLEPTLDQFLNHLIAVFSEVRRVLRDDGTMWINIGDGYTSGNRGYRAPDKKNPARAMSMRPDTPEGLKRKDLIGVPWRLAFALQRDGWFLRSDIVWNKPNAMPESVKDRPTRSHEYLFLFSKSEKYYYDYKAVKEENGRNRRSVWNINNLSLSSGHSAAFPPKLIEPCIQASTRPGDYVMDPFFGSGTVGLVCSEHGREYVGIELNPEYVSVAVGNLGATEESVLRIAI